MTIYFSKSTSPKKWYLWASAKTTPFCACIFFALTHWNGITLWNWQLNVTLKHKIMLTSRQKSKKYNPFSHVILMSQFMLYVYSLNYVNRSPSPITHWGLNKMVTCFEDNIFKCNFFKENFSFWFIMKSLKFFPNSLTYKSALVQVMVWCWTIRIPLPKPMLTYFTDLHASPGLNELLHYSFIFIREMLQHFSYISTMGTKTQSNKKKKTEEFLIKIILW